MKKYFTCPECGKSNAYLSQYYNNIIVHKCNDQLNEVGQLIEGIPFSNKVSFNINEIDCLINENINKQKFNKMLVLKYRNNIILKCNLKGLSVNQINIIDQNYKDEAIVVMKELFKKKIFSENLITYEWKITETPF